jgi:integrase
MVSEVNGRFVKSPSAEDVTFRYLFDNWIKGLSLTTDRVRAETTQYQERRRFERHVAPRFGDALIAKIEPVQIKRFYNELRTGGKDQKPLSTTSVARIHETLRAMCAWGVEMEMISDNPFQKVKRPKVVVPTPRPPESDAVGYLLNELWKNDRKLWLAVRLAATTGARRSELAALRWLDVRWQTKGTYVTLDKGLIRVPHRGPLRTETKTGAAGAGRLKVDEVLSEGLKQQYLEHLKANDTDPRAFIFASDKAGQIPWHPDTFTSKIRRANDAIGRGQKSKRITFKSLRAFTASELANQGRDVTTAQAVLRHKSPQTTLRHYSAARERSVREATEGVGEALNKYHYD